ncbi:MAG: hypothetical protein M3Y27_11730, partial [Acidobacteriota bacterium]|nr:hypothetical protein [Acidobacteriota bacterium]
MLQVNGALEVPSVPADAADILVQVDRINSSPPFRNSPLLQSFLKSIVEKSVANCESEINEYFIATEVFSRMPDFDPSADTIVRTQAYRLRLKLQEYYRTLGQDDKVLIDVPKGHYVPVFRHKEELCEEPPAIEPSGENTLSLKTNRSFVFYIVLAAASVALFLIGRWSARVQPDKVASASAQDKPLSDAERSFWENFLAGDRQPFVAYTNGQFLGNDNGDLLRFSGGPVGDRGTMVRQYPANEKQTAAQGSPLYFIDDVTGVGEVLGSVSIVDTLARLGVHPSFKRSRLVTTYDLQTHNVIFLGSPSVNPILNELPPPPGFGFAFANTRPFLWRTRIDAVKPALGEPANFVIERDPGSGVLRTDYATISLLPGIAPGRRILVLAGLTTSGTQAAAEAVTSAP